MNNTLTNEQIQELKKGKYRYVRFVDGRLEGSNSPQDPNIKDKGIWEEIELGVHAGQPSMTLFTGQVLDLQEI